MKKLIILALLLTVFSIGATAQDIVKGDCPGSVNDAPKVDGKPVEKPGSGPADTTVAPK